MLDFSPKTGMRQWHRGALSPSLPQNTSVLNFATGVPILDVRKVLQVEDLAVTSACVAFSCRSRSCMSGAGYAAGGRFDSDLLDAGVKEESRPGTEWIHDGTKEDEIRSKLYYC